MTIVKRKVESAPIKYVTLSQQKPGDTLVVGEFIGTSKVPNFAKDGEVPLHKFQTDDGIVALNSAGQLDFLMSKIDPGSTVEVVFLGKETIVRKNGQKTKANQFEVSILEEEVA